jgi:hypothetical protein
MRRAGRAAAIKPYRYPDPMPFREFSGCSLANDFSG